MKALTGYILGFCTAIMVSCGQPIPKFDGIIRLNDTQNKVFTYVKEDGTRVNEDRNDPKFHAARCYTPEDHEKWVKTYILGCKEWKEGVQLVPTELVALPLIQSEEALK